MLGLDWQWCASPKATSAAAIALLLGCGPASQSTWDDIDFAFIGLPTGPDAEPRISGGDSIAEFVRELSSEQRVTSTTIAWHRDGASVLCAAPLDGDSQRGGDWALWSVDIDGSLSLAELDASHASVTSVGAMTPSPSGRTLLIEVGTSENVGASGIGRHLLRVDLETADPEATSVDLWPDGAAPAWSGDDIFAATFADVTYEDDWTPVYSPRGIYIHNAKTDEIAYPDIQTEADERSPAFSPDGSVLAYASDASGHDEIMLWPVAGGPASSIGAAPCAPTRLWWLPEGEGLLVGCDTEFAVIDREGGAVLPVQPGTPRDLAPDGGRVLLELIVDAEPHVAVFDLGDRSTVDLGPGRAPVWRPMR
jgi:WD40 repeat protein